MAMTMHDRMPTSDRGLSADAIMFVYYVQAIRRVLGLTELTRNDD